MSLLSFTKCFIGAGGEQAATALTTAMVNMDPETATAAELKDMEQDLDAAGQLISRLQRELADGMLLVDVRSREAGAASALR